MRNANDVLKEATEAHLKGDFGHAEYLYCKLIGHDPDHPVAVFSLGTLYAQLHLHGRAIPCLHRAIELMPEGNGAMENLAGVYREAGHKAKAEYWNDEALKRARTPIALSNRAGLYINEGEPEKALQWADEALAMNPEMAEAGNHRALALLEMGRFDEGWKAYDSRLRLPQFHRRPYPVPLWKGGAAKLLAIHGEQGLGDEIMFLTCLKQIRQQYPILDVVIECAPRLVKLLSNSLGVRCYGTHAELVAAEEPDFYIPMGSLPGFVWPVEPNAYLKPTTTRLPSDGRPRIGISWFGGQITTHMALRNAPVEQWTPLMTLPADFVSLQYGPRADEAAQLSTPHDEDAIADLDQLAALIKSCDLVVSVCNTTVHMAGALGVPCLCLTPAKPAWRYGLTGERMAWYDSVKLLRQGTDEQWSSVIDRARAELERAIEQAAYLRGLQESQSQAARITA